MSKTAIFYLSDSDNQPYITYEWFEEFDEGCIILDLEAYSEYKHIIIVTTDLEMFDMIHVYSRDSTKQFIIVNDSDKLHEIRIHHPYNKLEIYHAFNGNYEEI